MNRTWDGSYEVLVFVSAIMGNFFPKLVDFVYFQVATYVCFFMQLAIIGSTNF